jgi:hypothetical protein
MSNMHDWRKYAGKDCVYGMKNLSFSLEMYSCKYMMNRTLLENHANNLL